MPITDQPTTGRAKEAVSVFAWVDRQHQLLAETHDLLLLRPDQKSISRCKYLAHQIQKGCRQQPTGLLAALQLNRNAQFQHVKELYCGVLAELIGVKCKVAPASRLSMICAALTQDIGMLDLQDDRLDRQSIALTEQQQRQIRKHPIDGIKILTQAGVDDRIWLSIVERHHERLDGTGYPHRLDEGQIDMGSRIMTLVDNFVAMARPRGDRAAMMPPQILQQIFRNRGEQIDPRLAKVLIDVLGLKPPGCWVHLANGEIAVVVRPSSHNAFPVVASIIGPDGEHYEQAIERDSGEHGFNIVECVTAPFHFNLRQLLEPLWPRLDN
ncbi:HD-GYP domain-containing protein [Motiliproteus sp.]|uniref:HD-GYP domain-containing protein n=1 Tax=Motiliproteus sp. TaxID=1898955 RepID=UPI003BAD1549